MPAPDDKTGTEARQNRVILCATCYPDAEAAMTLATELARQTGAELHGILMRDRAAMPATGGMVSAVVSYSGTRVPDVTLDDMLRAFRADAKRFHDHLLRGAREASVKAAFREAEGSLSDTAPSSTDPHDVLVYGFKRIMRGGNDLVVIPAPDGHIPEFADTLAHRLKARLVVLPAGQSAAELLARLNRMSPAAVLLSGAGPGTPSIRRIVEAARCPVIVSRPPPD